MHQEDALWYMWRMRPLVDINHTYRQMLSKRDIYMQTYWKKWAKQLYRKIIQIIDDHFKNVKPLDWNIRKDNTVIFILLKLANPIKKKWMETYFDSVFIISNQNKWLLKCMIYDFFNHLKWCRAYLKSNGYYEIQHCKKKNVGSTPNFNATNFIRQFNKIFKVLLS